MFLNVPLSQNGRPAPALRRIVEVVANIPSGIDYYNVNVTFTNGESCVISDPNVSVYVLNTTEISKSVTYAVRTHSFGYKNNALGNWLVGLATASPLSVTFSAGESGTKTITVNCRK